MFTGHSSILFRSRMGRKAYRLSLCWWGSFLILEMLISTLAIYMSFQADIPNLGWANPGWSLVSSFLWQDLASIAGQTAHCVLSERIPGKITKYRTGVSSVGFLVRITLGKSSNGSVGPLRPGRCQDCPLQSGRLLIWHRAPGHTMPGTDSTSRIIHPLAKPLFQVYGRLISIQKRFDITANIPDIRNL